jgi:hypothetical protein
MRPELLAEETHGLDKFLTVPIAVDQNFLVSNDLWGFHGEYKTGRRLASPILDSFDRRDRVKRRVHLNGIEASGVKAEVIGLLHPHGIERPLPAGRVKEEVPRRISAVIRKCYLAERGQSKNSCGC